MLQVQLAFSSKMKKLSSLLVLFCSIVLILYSYQANSHDEVEDEGEFNYDDDSEIKAKCIDNDRIYKVVDALKLVYTRDCPLCTAQENRLVLLEIATKLQGFLFGFRRMQVF